MRPFSSKINPHKREKRHEVHFLVGWWSLFDLLETLVGRWALDTASQRLDRLIAACMVTLNSVECSQKKSRAGFFKSWAKGLGGFICFFFKLNLKKRGKIWKLGTEGKGGSWRREKQQCPCMELETDSGSEQKFFLVVLHSPPQRDVPCTDDDYKWCRSSMYLNHYFLFFF